MSVKNYNGTFSTATFSAPMSANDRVVTVTCLFVVWRVLVVLGIMLGNTGVFGATPCVGGMYGLNSGSCTLNPIGL
jgi:hypothetical protein